MADNINNSWWVEETAPLSADLIPPEEGGLLLPTQIASGNFTQPISAISDFNIGISGKLYGGQSSYDNGVGVWLGLKGGLWKFSLGNSAGNKLTWNGSVLSITGSLTATSGSIGGFTISTTALYAGTGATRIQLDTTAGIHLGATAFADAPFRVSLAGALTATSATITGTVNATAGKFGTATNYWSIGATGLTAISASTDVIINYGKTDFDNTQVGFILGYDFSATLPKFYIGTTTAYLNFTGSAFSLRGTTIDYPTLTNLQIGSEIDIQGWQNTCLFSSTDYNTVAWTSGTISLLDGTTFSISAGNTGNITALTYIYLDKAVSLTVLQTTTVSATTMGSGKIRIAVCSPNTDITSKAPFQAFGGSGGQLLTVDSIAANSASVNEFISNTAQIKDAVITSAKITSLVADKITAGTGLINSLSVLSTLTMGSAATDGYIQSYGWNGTVAGFQLKGGATPTFTLIGGTITGGIFQTASSGARTVFNTSGIQGYDATTQRYNIANDGSGWLGASTTLAWTTAGVLTLGGFTASATTLTGGVTNIILDSSNKAISINDATFGARGIQLQYNAGTPRAYVGNGSDQYFQFDGANAEINGTQLLFQSIYGDGSDGDVTISSNTNLTRDAYYNNLTISGSSIWLNPNGYRIFVKGTLTIAATCRIQRDGNSGGNGANASADTGGIGGAAGTALAAGSMPGSVAGIIGGNGRNGGSGGGGTAGDTGGNGVDAAKSVGGTGANGVAGGRGGNNDGGAGGGGAGGGAGTGGTQTGTVYNTIKNVYSAFFFSDTQSSTLTNFTSSAGTAGSGGGGGGDGSIPGTGGGGGGAGGSGSSGGIILVFARSIVLNGDITAYGGTGGNGGNGANGVSGNSGGGGGGGSGCGGTGGVCVVVYNKKTGAGTIITPGGNGGIKGIAGIGIGTGTAGLNGEAGNAGGAGKTVILIV